MRPRGRHYPSGSSSLDQPRRLGSLINTTYASAIHTASLLDATTAFSPSTSNHNGYPELTSAYAHHEADDDLESTTSAEEEDEYEEDYEEGYYQDQEDLEDDLDEDEDYEDYDDDDDHDDHDNNNDNDSHSYHSAAHLCPHNHRHLLQHHHPHPLQPRHHSFMQELDDYGSDEHDMSEDAGTPLVNYLNITNILSADMMDTDISVSEQSSEELEYSSEIDAEGEEDEEEVRHAVGDSESESYSDTISESESEIESDGSGDGDSHGGNSSVESQPADDASVQTFSPPYISGLIASGINPMDMLPHAPMPPQMPGQTASEPFMSYILAEHGADAWFEPNGTLNSAAASLTPNNHGLVGFLHQWARQGRMLQGLSRGKSPWPDKVNEIADSDVTRIKNQELQGDKCDIQGINWDGLGVTRKETRERRLLTYTNYTNRTGSDRWTPDLPDVILPRSDSFFRFRRLDVKRNTHLSHFQLRYLLACTSRTRVFYPGAHTVHQFNPISRQSRPVIKADDLTMSSQVSAIASDCGVLVAGFFNGDYKLRCLDSQDMGTKDCRTGHITSDPSGITNHIQIYPGRRSSNPSAVFSSNDNSVRVLDIETEQWLSEDKFTFPVNCTTISTDKRLRAVVGDSKNLLITAAESTLGGGKPEIFYELKGHRDYGFAVDWADDGWTIASAFQDKTVKIWDARRLTDSSGESIPVTTIRTEMAGARNLRFSPIGSGKRVLVAAEEADYINIIDAQTFRSKQTIDFFGEIGGISFANEGQDLIALCCDPDRGGIFQFERCGWGRVPDDLVLLEDIWEEGGRGGWYSTRVRSSTSGLDWPPSLFTDRRRFTEGTTTRLRMGTVGDDIEPF